MKPKLTKKEGVEYYRSKDKVYKRETVDSGRVWWHVWRRDRDLDQWAWYVISGKPSEKVEIVK